MQLHIDTARLSAIRAFATAARCPHCSDWMVAPVMSEFVEDGEIRHHLEMRRLRATLPHLDPAHDTLSGGATE